MGLPEVSGVMLRFAKVAYRSAPTGNPVLGRLWSLDSESEPESEPVSIVPVFARAFAKDTRLGPCETKPSVLESESVSESELVSESDSYGLYFDWYILLFMYEVLFLDLGPRGQNKV
jgi:hypothetical protein